MRQNKQVATPLLATKKEKPASVAGFRFINAFGDKTGTMINVKYKPAKIHDKGDKWFVYYSYLSPISGKFERFKVYEGINRIIDLKAKKEFALKLKDAVNLALSEGFDPYKRPESKRLWTLNEIINYYRTSIPEMDLRDRSKGSYLSMLKVIQDSKEKVLNYTMNEISKAKILELFESIRRQRNWSNTTYNGNLGYFRTMLEWSKAKGLIKENPIEKIDKRKASPKKNKAYTREEFSRIFDYLKKNNLNLYWFCRFVYYTCTRPIQETRYITIGMIDFDQKQLAIPGNVSKNKKTDRIPLADELLSYLEPFKDLPSDYYVFTNEGTPGPKMSGKNHFTNAFFALRSILKISPDSGIYSFKHTRGIHLANAGVDPYKIMALMRHSSLEMTTRYLRELGGTLDREAVEV